MLSDYHKAMFFDNTGEPAKAQKAFMSAFGQSEIRDLTKDMMLERADAIKGQLKKGKDKKKKNQEEVVEEQPVETPAETPAEEPKQ